LKAGFEADGHRVRWIHDPAAIEEGDIAFLLSLGRIVPAAVLHRHAHNLVVHESALPEGRGWSPLTWQILEGKREIAVTLFEAAAGADSGVIYDQDRLRFQGTELLPELRAAQAAATLQLCRRFVARYPAVSSTGRPQVGVPTYYPRRRAADSRLDPDKTLREQFNLLRVADPERYPALIDIDGQCYQVQLHHHAARD
jgi:methionyl-tRNA formyltransferase